MKTQLLIATDDLDYAEHLSNTISDKHADIIEVCVCSTAERLREQLPNRRFDAALLEAPLAEGVDMEAVRLPLLLWSEDCGAAATGHEGYKKIRKYQRISLMVSNVLELVAKSQVNDCGLSTKRACITSVWSPAGGVGKTTAALALCARRASEGKQALYLDLEPFSSVNAYFDGEGRSISAAFEMLESGEGNIKMLARSILKHDAMSEIAYFCRPENYDDMNILSAEQITELIDACCEVTDELIIDLGGQCDERTRKVFELSDRVFLVTDSSGSAKMKYAQFVSQHNVFQRIKGKSTLVANKGAMVGGQLVTEVICFPLVQSDDSATIYKTLAGAIL